MEKEVDEKLPFLDVMVAKQTANSFTISIYHKTTYTALFRIFFSFIAFSYKIGLVKTLIDRTFKINKNWQGFQNEITKLISTLTKTNFHNI